LRDIDYCLKCIELARAAPEYRHCCSTRAGYARSSRWFRVATMRPSRRPSRPSSNS
jgi:hypothetical protein